MKHYESLRILMECKQYTDVQEFLVQNEFDYNCTFNNGLTPLHMAIELYDLKLVTLFINLIGININCLNAIGDTPLNYLIINVDINNNNYCYLDILKILIDNGADIDCESILTNRKPLENLIIQRKLFLLQYLLKSNANVTFYNYIGDTVIHSVIRNAADVDIFKILLKHFINIDLVNKFGISPLELAINLKNKSYIISLFMYNVKVDYKNDLIPILLQQSNTHDIKFFLYHLAKRNRNNLNDLLLCSTFKNYKDYLLELIIMQNTLANDSAFNYFDILINFGTTILFVTNNENQIFWTLKKQTFVFNKFPLYFSYLDIRIVRAITRKNLYKIIFKNFTFQLFQQLPINIKYNIFSIFNKKELDEIIIII